ncbi:HAMP domain-containing sensor histidine kinase [Lacibacter sp. H375]|uniref:sensor histidine kinase n=1 Tax=Lacibacter sp. H375 TaxID=3133424 RepID=UPI0030C258B9
MQDRRLKTETAKDEYKQMYNELVEIAAHDLKAPLRKLAVFTDRLTAKFSAQGNDEVNEYVHRIHSCINEMNELIDAMTEYAGLTPGSMTIEKCELTLINEKVFKLLGSEINEAETNLEISDLPQIEADENQLVRLFRSLLENALKFRRPGSLLKIKIFSEVVTNDEKNKFHLEEKGEYHKISIKDNGIGFKQEHAEKIFHPLVRLNGKSSYPGNGLGLAMCERIVTNHKGIMYGESNEEGTQFSIIFPEKN